MNIDASNLEKKLIEWSVNNSGYDEHRDYIGLSTLADCSRIIYHRYFNRVGLAREGHLKTRYCYEVEENIKERFRRMGLYSPEKEISIFDGLVKGHTDGEILGYLLEIKTVPETDHIPRCSVYIPGKVYWQVQAYMLYGSYNRAFLIYLARKFGLFRVFIVTRDESLQSKINIRVNDLVEAVRRRKIPACECGKCEKKG